MTALARITSLDLPNGSEQDQIPALFLAKQEATYLYTEWCAERVSCEEVEKAYLLADALCVSYGWEHLENMPMTGNFIPSKYTLLGHPRLTGKGLKGAVPSLPPR